MTKKVEISWKEDGSVKLRCLEGDVNVLEAAELMEVVSDRFSIV